MIIMWLEGIWGLYTGLQWSRNKFLDELQIEPSIWISIPPVCQADFQLQLRHVEAAAKSERDKMEDGSCSWLDPENPGKHAMFQTFPCKRNKHTLSLGILPRQINQWFLTSYESLNSMWGKLNEIWSDLLWASSALCFPPDLRQRRIFDLSCGIWKVQLQNMRQPRWVTRFFFSFWIGGEGNQRKKSIISGDNLFLVLGLRGCLRVFQSCRFFFSFPF